MLPVEVGQTGCVTFGQECPPPVAMRLLLHVWLFCYMLQQPPKCPPWLCWWPSGTNHFLSYCPWRIASLSLSPFLFSSTPQKNAGFPLPSLQKGIVLNQNSLSLLHLSLTIYTSKGVLDIPLLCSRKTGPENENPQSSFNINQPASPRPNHRNYIKTTWVPYTEHTHTRC